MAALAAPREIRKNRFMKALTIFKGVTRIALVAGLVARQTASVTAKA